MSYCVKIFEYYPWCPMSMHISNLTGKHSLCHEGNRLGVLRHECPWENYLRSLERLIFDSRFWRLQTLIDWCCCVGTNCKAAHHSPPYGQREKARKKGVRSFSLGAVSQRPKFLTLGPDLLMISRPLSASKLESQPVQHRFWGTFIQIAAFANSIRPQTERLWLLPWPYMDFLNCHLSVPIRFMFQ